MRTWRGVAAVIAAFAASCGGGTSSPTAQTNASGGGVAFGGIGGGSTLPHGGHAATGGIAIGSAAGHPLVGGAVSASGAGGTNEPAGSAGEGGAAGANDGGGGGAGGAAGGNEGGEGGAGGSIGPTSCAGGPLTYAQREAILFDDPGAAITCIPLRSCHLLDGGVDDNVVDAFEICMIVASAMFGGPAEDTLRSCVAANVGNCQALADCWAAFRAVDGTHSCDDQNRLIETDANGAVQLWVQCASFVPFGTCFEGECVPCGGAVCGGNDSCANDVETECGIGLEAKLPCGDGYACATAPPWTCVGAGATACPSCGFHCEGDVMVMCSESYARHGYDCAALGLAPCEQGVCGGYLLRLISTAKTRTAPAAPPSASLPTTACPPPKPAGSARTTRRSRRAASTGDRPDGAA